MALHLNSHRLLNTNDILVFKPICLHKCQSILTQAASCPAINADLYAIKYKKSQYHMICSGHPNRFESGEGIRGSLKLKQRRSPLTQKEDRGWTQSIGYGRLWECWLEKLMETRPKGAQGSPGPRSFVAQEMCLCLCRTFAGPECVGLYFEREHSKITKNVFEFT